MERTPDLKKVLVIGLPRSGTSIVTSYLNSQEGALVVGEPTWPQRAQRDQLMFSRYGDMIFSHKKDIFEQLEHVAKDKDLSLIGIKEAWVPAVNAIKIARTYYDILDDIIITLREPRRNYLSMHYQFTSIGPVSLVMFERHYQMLYKYGVEKEKARFVILEQFKKDPLGILSKAAPNLKLKEIKELYRYSGGGCRTARSSKEVTATETTGQSEERFPIAELAYRLAMREVEKY